MEIRGSRILHHRIQNHLQVVTDTAFLLDCELVIRTDNHLKIFIPKLHHPCLGDVRHIGRTLFPVPRVKPGNHVAQELARLRPDITFPVHEKLIEKPQRLFFLLIVCIGEIFFKNIQVGADILPALLASGRLQKISKLAFRRHAVHDFNIMFYSHKNERLYGLLRISERNVGKGRPFYRMAVQPHIHSQGTHVILEVMQLGIYEAVAVQLCLVHIVQFGQDDIKRLIETGNISNLPAILSPALFYPEIRVNQYQRFH